MKQTVLALFAAIAPACAPLSYGSLATSTAALACDWSQTRASAERDWVGSYEGNPLLGRHPSPDQLDAYFGGIALANLALWLVLPREVDWIVPGVITGAQLWTIRNNLETSPGFCGR